MVKQTEKKLFAGKPGPGRPKGVKNKASAAREAEIAASGLTPLQYLTSVYQDVSADQARRIDAAKAAAQYVHPKLQPVDATGNAEQRIRVEGALAWQAPT